VTYSYDGNGNLTGSTDGNSFSYNKKNQTTAIDGNSYSYSGPDQTERVSINSTSDAYSGLGLSYETTSGNTTYYTRCSCGMLLNERLPGGGKYYYLFDGQGSVVGLTGSNGNEVNAYDYDPYGVMLNETQGQPNPFQYEGGYFESSTGLVKFGTRYYNPNLGRWTQQDPVAGSLGNPDTLNRYLYVTDDPVNEVDPSGNASWWCAGALSGLILGVVEYIQAIQWALPIIGWLFAYAAASSTPALLAALAWTAGIFIWSLIIFGIIMGAIAAIAAVSFYCG